MVDDTQTPEMASSAAEEEQIEQTSSKVPPSTRNLFSHVDPNHISGTASLKS
jgi:hypothetical protein